MSIYSYDSYKEYFKNRLNFSENSKASRGSQIKIARALRCDPAFVNRILRSHSHLSPEQAEELNLYWNHDEDEAEFFLLLIQRDRAGHASLYSRIDKKIKTIRKLYSEIENKVPREKQLSPAEESIYYSSWIYGALHVLVSIPRFQNEHELLKFTGLRPGVFNKTLEFLLRIGLLKRENSKLLIGPQSLHLGKTSPFLTAHHRNWRTKVLEELSKGSATDNDSFQYSAIVTLSRKDLHILHEQLLESLRKMTQVISQSPEEEACILCLDLVPLKEP